MSSLSLVFICDFNDALHTLCAVNKTVGYPIFHHVTLSPPIRSVTRGIADIGDESFILPEISRHDAAWWLVVRNAMPELTNQRSSFYFLRLGLSRIGNFQSANSPNEPREGTPRERQAAHSFAIRHSPFASARVGHSNDK